MNSAFEEAWKIIMGDKSGGYYIAGFFFSGLGMIISLYHNSRKRDKDSPDTPYNFSWRFLIWDNVKRTITTLAVMFILYRTMDLSDVSKMIGVGITVTIALDKVVGFIMKKYEWVCNLLSMKRK